MPAPDRHQLFTELLAAGDVVGDRLLRPLPGGGAAQSEDDTRCAKSGGDNAAAPAQAAEGNHGDGAGKTQRGGVKQMGIAVLRAIHCSLPGMLALPTSS